MLMTVIKPLLSELIVLTQNNWKDLRSNQRKSKPGHQNTKSSWPPTLWWRPLSEPWADLWSRLARPHNQSERVTTFKKCTTNLKEPSNSNLKRSSISRSPLESRAWNRSMSWQIWLRPLTFWSALPKKVGKTLDPSMSREPCLQLITFMVDYIFESKKCYIRIASQKIKNVVCIKFKQKFFHSRNFEIFEIFKHQTINNNFN